MNRSVCLSIFAISAVSLFAGVVSFGKQPNEKQNLLDTLKPGQLISLKEETHGFGLLIIENQPLSNKIVEVGNDYLKVTDPTGLTETAIPIYQLRYIRTIKSP